MALPPKRDVAILGSYALELSVFVRCPCRRHAGRKGYLLVTWMRSACGLYGCMVGVSDICRDPLVPTLRSFGHPPIQRSLFGPDHSIRSRAAPLPAVSMAPKRKATDLASATSSLRIQRAKVSIASTQMTAMRKEIVSLLDAEPAVVAAVLHALRTGMFQAAEEVDETRFSHNITKYSNLPIGWCLERLMQAGWAEATLTDFVASHKSNNSYPVHMWMMLNGLSGHWKVVWGWAGFGNTRTHTWCSHSLFCTSHRQVATKMKDDLATALAARRTRIGNWVVELKRRQRIDTDGSVDWFSSGVYRFLTDMEVDDRSANANRDGPFKAVMHISGTKALLFRISSQRWIRTGCSVSCAGLSLRDQSACLYSWYVYPTSLGPCIVAVRHSFCRMLQYVVLA